MSESQQGPETCDVISRKGYCSCFLSSVAMDGKHGHGLKLEKAGPLFSSFNVIPAKIAQKIL